MASKNPVLHDASRGEPFPGALREKLAAMVATVGEVEVARRAGMSRQTIVRAMAGVGVYRDTRVVLEALVTNWGGR